MQASQSDELARGVVIEPLTHSNADGIVYQREHSVERQITEALRLSTDRLCERAAVLDQESPSYLKEECLVYLIRHFQRADEQRLVSDLAEALLRRCAKLIEGRLRKLDTDSARRDGYSDVIERLFGQIVDLDNDRGDFLQVRFWPAVEKLAVRAFNRQLAQQNRDRDTVPLSSLAGYDRDEDENSGRLVRPREDDVAVSSPADSLAVRNDLIRDALSRIDEPIRSAFLLRHYLGWPIEDQDPDVRTISGYFGKDPRTIRNWMRRAEEILKPFRGEQR